VQRKIFGLNGGEIKEDRENYLMISVIVFCMKYSYDGQILSEKTGGAWKK
jgi:hypothetical protein